MRHHAGLLVGGDLGEDRQREDLPRRLLGDREAPRTEAKVRERPLEVDRDRVVDLRADAVGVEPLDHLVAVRDADDVEMKDVLVSGERARARDRRQVGEQLVVAAGGAPARFVPTGEALELGVEHHRLQRVEPRVEPELRVVVLHLAAVVAQRPDLAPMSSESVVTAPASP